MKSKIKYILVIFAALVISAACFAACGDSDGGGSTGGHIHTYSAEWEHDADSHWHNATCGHNVKSGEARHSFSGGVCVCGLKADLSVWQSDENTHWHDAEYNGVTERISEAPHRLVNNECECGLKIELKTRIYVDTFRIVGVIGDMPAGAHITVPEKISGCAVVEISDAAFEGQRNMASVSLPETITDIKTAAFRGCSSLTEISLKNVKQVPQSAFEDCTSLKSVELSPELTSIGTSAFCGCSALTEFNVPDTVASLGEQAFARCASLQSINVPDGITRIGRNTFLGCSKLSRVTLPDTVASISAQAFARCTSLQSIELPENLEFIGMAAFRGSGLTSVKLPDSVTQLGTYAFTDCAALVSAALSKNITYAIDDWFGGCGALSELTVPFVGSHANAAEAAETAFGFIFGTDEQSSELFAEVMQGTHKYYIPKSLKKVTVLNGTLTGREFEGCDMISEIVLGSGATDLRPAA